MCFWFWIYQGSGYTTVLNMPELRKALNIPEYAWIIPGYAWLCLNVSKSVWLTVWFCFLFQNEYFYKKDSKFAVTFGERVGPGARIKYIYWVYQTQPMIYPINIFIMFFNVFFPILLLMVFHFLMLQKT